MLRGDLQSRKIRRGHANEAVELLARDTAVGSKSAPHEVSLLQPVRADLPRVLLLDDDQCRCQPLLQRLVSMGLFVEYCHETRSGVSKLRARPEQYDLVVVNISNRAKPWERIIHDLQEAAFQSHRQMIPSFLCASSLRHEPQLRLALERRGARVAYGYSEILEHVEFLLLERRTLKAMGSHFRIIHRFRAPGTDCAPGEEIAGVFLVASAREYAIRLSRSTLIVFDYLSKHTRLQQTATQIVLGIAADPFYRKHSMNVSLSGKRTPKVSVSEVRVYIQRIRDAIEAASREAAILIDARKVLLSEGTISNTVAYRLKGSFEWMHRDHPGLDLD